MSSVAHVTPGGFFEAGIIYHCSTALLDTNRYMPEFWCTGADINPTTGEPVAWGFYRNHPTDDWTNMPLRHDEWLSGRWAAPGQTPPIDLTRPTTGIYALAGAPATTTAETGETVHVITSVPARHAA